MDAMETLRDPGATGSHRPILGHSITGTLIGAVIGCLSVATCYEALVAFGALGIGPDPGQVPSGENVVVLAAVVTLALGGLVLLAASLSRRPTLVPRRLAAFVPLAAVSFVVARWFSYDPYYAPTLRRMSDGGIVPGWWIVLLVVLAAGTAWAIFRGGPRAGTVLTVTVMWFSAITALASGAGH